MDEGSIRQGKAMTQYPQDQQPQPQPHVRQRIEPMSPADQRTWAIATHLSAFLAAFVALSFLGPLVMYLVFRDRGAYIRQHAAEALNFQLTMWIGLLISFPLMLVLVGFLTAGAIALMMLVFHILGAVAASEGQDFRYPLTIHFVS